MPVRVESVGNFLAPGIFGSRESNYEGKGNWELSEIKNFNLEALKSPSYLPESASAEDAIALEKEVGKAQGQFKVMRKISKGLLALQREGLKMLNLRTSHQAQALNNNLQYQRTITAYQKTMQDYNFEAGLIEAHADGYGEGLHSRGVAKNVISWS